MKKEKNKKSCGCGAKQVNLEKVAELTQEIAEAGKKAGEMALDMMAENRALWFVLNALIDDVCPEIHQDKLQRSVNDLVETFKVNFGNLTNNNKKGDKKDEEEK